MEQIIKIVLSIIFGLAAFAKLSGKTKDTFKKSGYGLAFMYATALGEALFAIGLFTQYDLWAAMGLLTIMVGAIVTLFRQRESPEKYALALLTSILLTALLLIKSAGI